VPDFDSELEAALPAVRALLRRLTGTPHDADDLSQEVWLRANRYRDSFDTSRPIAGWLGRIAFRQFLDWRRTRDRAPEPLGDADQRAAAPRDDPDRREWIERRLTLLRPVERDVLLRFHRDGEAVGDIARALRMPEGTVRSHLHRARRRIAEAEEP
jgi:RNA polymerase sigma-70 factor (ECF subfamily)